MADELRPEERILSTSVRWLALAWRLLPCSPVVDIATDGARAGVIWTSP
jgi:hypothetical protein